MVDNYAVTGEVDELSVLIISVARPVPRKRGEVFEELLHADAERKALTAALSQVPGVIVNVLKDDQATYNRVFDALETRRYHIVHYTGHADSTAPTRSPARSCSTTRTWTPARCATSSAAPRRWCAS